MGTDAAQDWGILGAGARLPAGGSRPVALTVAGFDPSSGAGITADLQVFANHGIYGVSAITALTVQSTQAVRRVEPVSAKLLRDTLDCLAEDVAIAGLKIGMLGTAELVGEVTAWLSQAGIPRERVVLDPVIRSSSAAELLEPEGVRRMRDELLGVVGWVTPNIDEAAVLAGGRTPGRTLDRTQVPEAARRLAALAPGLNVVVTGGHLEPPDDFLLTAAGEEAWIAGRRVTGAWTHGTGCAFSSALLCRLMLGDGPVEAVRGAKDWVRAMLEGRKSPGIP